MTHIFRPDPKEIHKWRTQATRAAVHLKNIALDKETLKLAFAFDDGLITVEVAASTIRALSAAALGDHLYNLVLAAAQTSAPAAGHA